jgi:hypothetical protein
MPAHDFFREMAFEQINPFSDRRSDIHAASICALIANIHRGKDSKAFTIHDFLIDWTPQEAKPQTAEDQMGIFLALQASQNAIVEQQERQRRG